MTATIAILMVGLLIAFDRASADLNPYKAPPLLALGSGTAASGGFCGALPE
ncbi:MAG: hypothetical protein H5U17_14315 [Defluviimonas sp.]|nr:hypothetical protein [Defluviimonas sp.]